MYIKTKNDSLARWLPFTDLDRPAEQAHLFCFPWSGGQAVSYRSWERFMPASVQLCPIEFPGHGTRFSEALLDTVDELIPQLIRDILPILDRPFFVFGHSLGALLGFEFCRHLIEVHNIVPCRLFVSGRRAPQRKSPPTLRHTLLDQDLIDNVIELGGVPAELLDSGDLMSLILPILRSDFRLTELYENISPSPLPIPITAITGESDPEVSIQEMQDWKEVSADSFSLHSFDGDHFYFLCPKIRRELILLICQHVNMPNSPLSASCPPRN